MVEEAHPIQGLQTQMLGAAKQTGKEVGGMPPGAVGTKGTGKILLRKSFALTFYNLRASMRIYISETQDPEIFAQDYTTLTYL